MLHVSRGRADSSVGEEWKGLIITTYKHNVDGYHLLHIIIYILQGLSFCKKQIKNLSNINTLFQVSILQLPYCHTAN